MDAATLARAMGCRPATANAYVADVNAAMLQAGCTTVNRAAMYCAQIGHESVGLQYMEEIASGSAYEGRKDLGNTVAGDGKRFKGRGPIQLTGRANYGKFGAWCDARGLVASAGYFIQNPAAVATSRWGFLAASWYWTVARAALNSYADAGNVTAATKAINGGTNGLTDRIARWNRCRALGAALLPVAPAAPPVAAAVVVPPPIRRPRQQEDTDMLIVSPEPTDRKAPRSQWPTVRRSMGFDPIGGWGGRMVIKAHFGGDGGWIHLLRWWVRDPNWSANAPKHFAVEHPGAREADPGVERFVGYAWESAPPVGADELDFVIAAPDGMHIFPFYEK